jgi:hypothetical protein
LPSRPTILRWWQPPSTRFRPLSKTPTRHSYLQTNPGGVREAEVIACGRLTGKPELSTWTDNAQCASVRGRLLASRGGGGWNKQTRQGKSPKPKRPKAKLGLPDLDHSKSAVLDSLRSPESKRGYRHAIDEFIQWYCSEPRLSFNRVVVTRYRIFLENRQLAAGMINGRLAAVRRLAYEAADAGLLSPELAAGIRRVKGAKKLGVRLGNWLTAEEARRFWQSPAQTHSKESGTVRFSPCCWVADSAAANWLIWTSRIL